VGITTITASQAASDDGIYPSSVATIRFDVTLVTPSFGSFSVGSRDFGSVPFTLTPPTSNSSGAFSYSSSDPTIASIVGNVVTVVKAGTITITATQAAATIYTSKTVNASFVVNPIAPTFGSFSVGSRDFGTAPFTLTPPTSNSSGAFSYTSGNTGIATIVGSTVTIVGAGTTIITATQASTTNYNSKTVTASFVVNPIAPTLGSFSIAPRDFGSVPFSILPNTHTVLYIRNGGSDWITKLVNNDTSNTNLQAWAGIDKQWFDLNYGEWNEVALQFRFFSAYVSKFYNITSASCVVVSAYGNIGTYSFTFNGGTSYTGTFNGQVQSWDYALPADFTVNRNSLQPTSNSLGVFSYASNNIAVASIVGNQVTIVGAGTAIITVTQAAAGNYTASSSITTPLVVNPIAPTFGSFSIGSREFDSAPFTLTPPSSNSLGAFSYTSSRPEFATVDSTTGVVTIVGVGTSVITATQAATTNYTSKSIGADFVVNRFTTILSDFGIVSRFVDQTPFTLTPPTSNRPGVFNYSSLTPEIATVDSITGQVTILRAGTATIRATQIETPNYTESSITRNCTIWARCVIQ
jgi:uncharacterized protein YjdB